MNILNQKFMFSILAVLTMSAVSGLTYSDGSENDSGVDHPDKTRGVGVIINFLLGDDRPGKPVVPAKPQKQWYIATTVVANDSAAKKQYQGVNPAVLGKLAESNDGRDKHDIRPYVSLLSDKAAVLFNQPDWGDDAGQYLADYRTADKEDTDWEMTVTSTVVSATITLKWSGLFDVTSIEAGGAVRYKQRLNLDSDILKNLHLVDLETQQVTDAISADGHLNTYSFTMGSAQTTRQFRWVMGELDADALAPAKKAFPERALSQPVSVLSAPSTGDKFGLPPGG